MNLPPESMQQIAFPCLLTTIIMMMSLVCVQGIINHDGGASTTSTEENASIERRKDFDDYDGGGGGMLNFRQNEFITFTAEDAKPTTAYSYWNANRQEAATFSQKAPVTPMASLNGNGDGDAGGIQTQPILSYRDPYSDEELYYMPTTETMLAPKTRQEYTVQSSLLVGPNQQSHYDYVRWRQQEEQDANASNQRRPGLVFDESPQQQQQQHFNAYSQLPYKSQDYPPSPSPTPPPQNFQLPQRQDAGAQANYANGFGNYLPSAAVHGHQMAQHYQVGRPLPRPQRPSSPNHAMDKNYFEYQRGEIPPPPPPPRRQSTSSSTQWPAYAYSGAHNRPPIPIPRPIPPTPPPQSALANLVSLFSGTQQYAPQFTNLLLGSLTGGGSTSTSTSTAGRPPPPSNMQLIKALENIARNDDLQCVPKVLCQMIAARTERGELPNFVTSPAITNFLAGFPAASPAIIYGRAALLGISGGDASCTKTYSQCPKNEYEILYYLNNHRGGFFKFFSEPVENVQQNDDSGNGGNSNGGADNSIWGILGTLTGGANNVVQSKPKPQPKPTQPPSSNFLSSGLDITNSIGSFFTQAVSDYFSGVDYQRRRRRSLDDDNYEIPRNYNEYRDDEEDNLDTDNDDDDDDDGIANDIPGIQSRILHKHVLSSATDVKFFPEGGEVERGRQADGEYTKNLQDTLLRIVIEKYNQSKKSRHVKFPPTDDVKIESDENIGTLRSDEQIKQYPSRDHKQIVFQQETYQSHKDPKTERPQINHIVFPSHSTKTVRNGRILNRPYDATSPKEDRDKFILSDEHRNENSYNTHSSHLTHSTHSSKTQSHLVNAHGNRHSHQSGTSYADFPRPTHSTYAVSRPSTYSSHKTRYQTTRRPTPREDDKNVYVTNSQGVTEYYLTPDGRKVYL